MLYQLSHVRVPVRGAPPGLARTTLAESWSACVPVVGRVGELGVEGVPEVEFAVFFEVGDAAPELAVLGCVGGGERDRGHQGGAGVGGVEVGGGDVGGEGDGGGGAVVLA